MTKTLLAFESEKKRKKNPRPPAPSVYVDSRPQGAPALCDHPRELGQPASVHLQPLQRVVSARAPGAVVQVVLVQTGLQGATERQSGGRLGGLSFSTSGAAVCEMFVTVD